MSNVLKPGFNVLFKNLDLKNPNILLIVSCILSQHIHTFYKLLWLFSQSHAFLFQAYVYYAPAMKWRKGI